VVVVEAFKEYKTETDLKISKLEKELLEMKNLLNELLSKIKI
jgi:hypothetical protein